MIIKSEYFHIAPNHIIGGTHAFMHGYIEKVFFSCRLPSDPCDCCPVQQHWNVCSYASYDQASATQAALYVVKM